jgi:hypothetical protein
VELASQLFEYFAEDSRLFDGDGAQRAALQVCILPCVNEISILPQLQTLLQDLPALFNLQSRRTNLL